MRDAFGGVFMMRLMLVFITILVAFSAVSLNYAKAFRVKNKIIDVIEQAEIQDIKYVSSYSKKIDDIVENASYDKSHCKNGPITNEEGDTIGECRSGVIITIDKKHSTSEYIYYNVITYGGWKLDSLNMLLALGEKEQNSETSAFGRWAINGEAKVRNHVKNTYQFSEYRNDDRCYNGTWVRVTYCQPTSVVGAQCKLKNGAIVLRNDLRAGYGCQIPDIPYSEGPKGIRCDEEHHKWVNVTYCQPEDIGAHCKLSDDKTIIRTDLTKGRGCTTPKPAG